MWAEIGVFSPKQGVFAMLRRIILSAGGKVSQRLFGVKKLFTYFAVLGMLAICNLITAHAAERCPTTSLLKEKELPFAVISVSSKAVKLHTGLRKMEPFGSTVEPISFVSVNNPLGTKIYSNAVIGKQDYASLLASISKLKNIALKTVDEPRIFIVLSSTITTWDGSVKLSDTIVEAGLVKEVILISQSEEAENALLGITTDHRQLNESLLVDIGSGKTSISSVFFNKKIHDIRVVTLDGVTSIAEKLKNNERQNFAQEIIQNYDANPSWERKKLVLVGGIPYALALYAGAAPTDRFVPISKKIINNFITSIAECKNVIDLFPDNDIHEIFTLAQLQAGAKIMNWMEPILQNKSLYIGLNTPAWELMLGAKILGKTSTR